MIIKSILRTLFLLLFCTSLNFNSLAHTHYGAGQPEYYCAYKKFRHLKAEYNSRHLKFNDKSFHCIFSCRIAYCCGETQALHVGYFKELYDMISPGTPDIEDLQANQIGIELSQQLEKERDCESACLNIFTH